MNVKEFEIPVSWGKISGQIFGNPANSVPIVAVHGFLDNSNSFKPVAPYLTENGAYYIIAVDLPGMGFSSKIPEGIPYSTKFYLMCIRRLTRFFKLDKFIIMGHSFGCSLSLAYSALYVSQVSGIALIDFAMKECDVEFKDNLAECWKDGIETYLNAEEALDFKKQNGKTDRELTYEHALKRLLDSNKHIDEPAAKLLLERGLLKNNEKLEYSRDIRLVTGISMRDYHAEYAGIYDSLFDNLNHPVILIYANPAPFGEKLFEQIMHIMKQIETRSKSNVETVSFDGTHHFHMLKPVDTSQILLKFFNKFTTPIDKNNNSDAPIQPEITRSEN